MNRQRVPIVMLLGATLFGASTPSWAQDGLAQAQAAEAEAESTEGLDLLRAADRALREARGLAFTIHREGSGAQSTREPSTTARVVLLRQESAARAGLLDDAGVPQWKAAAFGRISSPDAEGGYVPFAFTIDADHVRRLDRQGLSLVEGELQSASDLLLGSGAWTALDWLSQWETLVGQPIVDNTPRVSPNFDGRVMIGDEPTRAVYVDLAEFPGTYAFGAWWYLGHDDPLPRRLEMVYYDVRDQDNNSVGDGISRVTLSNLRVLDDSTDVSAAVRDAARILDETNWQEPGGPTLAQLIDPEHPFTLPAPDGYEKRTYQPPVDERRAQRPPEPELNIPAPDFTLREPDGTEHTLSDYRGKIVILDFWATWCGPCLAVMPQLQEVHEQFKDQGVVMIGVNAWENGDPAALMAARNWNYLLLLEGDQVAAQYQVTGIPTMVVIDQEGQIVQRKVGADPGVKEDLVETITRLRGQE